MRGVPVLTRGIAAGRRRAMAAANCSRGLSARQRKPSSIPGCWSSISGCGAQYPPLAAALGLGLAAGALGEAAPGAEDAAAGAVEAAAGAVDAPDPFGVQATAPSAARMSANARLARALRCLLMARSTPPLTDRFFGHDDAPYAIDRREPTGIRAPGRRRRPAPRSVR